MEESYIVIGVVKLPLLFIKEGVKRMETLRLFLVYVVFGDPVLVVIVTSVHVGE